MTRVIVKETVYVQDRMALVYLLII